MRQHFLALMLLGVIMRGANSDGAAGKGKAAVKCRNPKGKLGQIKADGCGSNVCKKSGGGGAAWESCPLPASGEAVQEEMKYLTKLLNENENETKKIQELLTENQKETKKNQELLMEVLNRLGPVSTTMVPATTTTTTTTTKTTTTTTTTTKTKTTTTTTTTTTKSSSGLNVVFEKEAFKIAKNFLIGTLPYLGKKYKIRFECFITGFGSSWQTIIHFTIGGDDAVYGDRTPGVWLYNNNMIGVNSALQPTGHKHFPFAAKTGIWMTMEVSQYMVADNKFEFDFKIDGISYWTVENSRAEAFTDVKMFSGDNWYGALNGKIRNLQVLTRND